MTTVAVTAWLFATLHRIDLESETQKEAQLRQLEVEATYAEVARAAAHDIALPILALRAAIRETDPRTAEIQALVNGAVERLIDISSNLRANMRGVASTANRIELISAAKLSEQLRSLSSEFDTVTSATTEKAITFQYMTQDDGHDGYLWINTPLMLRTVSNIIRNAVESIEHEGVITIRLSTGTLSLSITVNDNGAGFSASALQNLFASGNTHEKRDGLGLGLHLAKRTVESMNGTITAGNSASGGAEVKISIPMSAGRPGP